MTLAELQFVGAAALVFIPLERLLPLHRDNRVVRAGLGVDVLHVLVSGFLIRTGTAAITLSMSFVCALMIPESFRESVRGQATWLQFLELLVLSDLCFYVAHRLVHAVPTLWRFHAVHHSSEQMDWLATYRVHPVDQILNSAIIAVPAVALGIAPGPLLAYALIYRIHAILLHSNVRVNFGPLRRVFASPQYHHWHHADEPHAYDRNFGGQLVIWDILFRTLYQPTTLPRRYGVGGKVPNGYAQQLIVPFLPVRQGADAEGDWSRRTSPQSATRV